MILKEDKRHNAFEILSDGIIAEVLEIVIPLIKEKQMDVAINKPFMSLSDSALYLDVSVRTMYSYVNKGRISHYKPVDGKIYFSVKELNEFILNDAKHYRSINVAKKELDERLKSIHRKKLGGE